MIAVSRFVTGPLETNTWLVVDEENRCIIIDPSTGCRELLSSIGKQYLKVEAIVLTHAHFDHIMGIPELYKKLGPLPVYVHRADALYLVNSELNGSLLIGEQYDFSGETKELKSGKQRLGSFDMEVIHTPGHTPGGCALLMETYCFCGDTVFAGSIGRSDLPGGDGDLLLQTIQRKIMTLPDSTTLCPGHGGRTTVAHEKASNPFLQ